MLKSTCQTLNWPCFKTFVVCTFNASKVSYFYLNDRLHAVSIGKPSERMSNFWTVRFLKIRTEFRFSAHPYLTEQIVGSVIGFQGMDVP